MIVAVLSDQHGELLEFPDSDIVILSGDLTGGNANGPRDHTDAKWSEWLRGPFTRWVESAKRPVYFIGGNHDTALESVWMDYRWTIENGVYLKDSGACYKDVLIWGAPWIPYWDGLAFNLREDEIKARWAKIPNQTDILLCHTPPAGCGSIGCPHLRDAIERIQPALVTCGHIHESNGIYRIGRTTVVNAARQFTVINLESCTPLTVSTSA